MVTSQPANQASNHNRDLFESERTIYASGVTFVAGTDEAGCGCLAGPVIAAAVVLPASWVHLGLPASLEGMIDSKQLSEKVRSKFSETLRNNPEVSYAVASVDVATIDRINIRQAAWLAMEQALGQLRPAPQHVLVDGLRIPNLRYPQTSLIKGDARSYSIAAASIIAKVERDRVMGIAEREYPGYGFAQHKGYGTVQHLEAIAQLGPCALHRLSFEPLAGPPKQLQLL